MTHNTQDLSQSPMNLDDWLCRIRDLHDKDIDMGLTRISEVADTMQLRHFSAQGTSDSLNSKSTKVILIGGTNGKGTTSRFIEAYLLSLGYTVGLFNSPALLNYTETVRVNGKPLDQAEHIKALAAIWHARGTVVLTEFEFSTLAALYLFKRRKLDFVLMEVGMGGRLDSTNVVEPDVSVLTTVAIDHIGFLGATREAIGFEKAGIFRSNKPAIVGELDIPQSVYQHGKAIGARLMCVNEDFAYQLENSTNSTNPAAALSWQWQSDNLSLSQLMLPTIAMQNVATALACLHQLKVALSSAKVNDVLADLQVEGRFETLLPSGLNDDQKVAQPQLIVDVAHNIEAVGYMVKRLKDVADTRPIYAVLGMLKDKDIDGVIALVKPIMSRYYLCDLATPRGASTQQLKTSLEKHQAGPYSCYASVADGLAVALNDVTNGADQALVVVFGSFFTVAAAKTFVAGENK